jgi:hypothetical protein
LDPTLAKLPAAVEATNVVVKVRRLISLTIGPLGGSAKANIPSFIFFIDFDLDLFFPILEFAD